MDRKLKPDQLPWITGGVQLEYRFPLVIGPRIFFGRILNNLFDVWPKKPIRVLSVKAVHNPGQTVEITEIFPYPRPDVHIDVFDNTWYTDLLAQPTYHTSALREYDIITVGEHYVTLDLLRVAMETRTLIVCYGALLYNPKDKFFTSVGMSHDAVIPTTVFNRIGPNKERELFIGTYDGTCLTLPYHENSYFQKG